MQDRQGQARAVGPLVTAERIGCAAVAHDSHVSADAKLLPSGVEVPAQLSHAAAQQLGHLSPFNETD